MAWLGLGGSREMSEEDRRKAEERIKAREGQAQPAPTPQKPSTGLGTGGAGQAAGAMKARQGQIDEIMKEMDRDSLSGASSRGGATKRE